MSYAKRAARRDSNETAIVEALLAAGASVTFLGGVDGLPDLLVGFDGRTHLFEVKHISATGKTVRRTSGGKRPDERGLTEDQQGWWAAWKGSPPVIVRTPDEALAAIGVTAPPCCPAAGNVCIAIGDTVFHGDGSREVAPTPVTTWKCSGCDLAYADADGLDLEAGVAPPLALGRDEGRRPAAATMPRVRQARREARVKSATAWTRFCRPELAGVTWHTHVNCDGCGAVETRTSWTADTPEMEQERRRAAEEQAEAKGWSIKGGHRCPACVRLAAGTRDGAPVFADGTAPGTRTVASMACRCADGVECSCGGAR